MYVLTDWVTPNFLPDSDSVLCKDGKGRDSDVSSPRTVHSEDVYIHFSYINKPGFKTLNVGESVTCDKLFDDALTWWN